MSLSPDTPHSAPRLPDTALLHDILESGLRAPSAENRHYLRFELTAGAIRIVSTDTPTWEAQPHRRMLAHLAYGAVVENMSLRAAQRGMAQSTQWLPDPANPQLIAHCSWRAVPPQDDPLATAIPARHTNRRFYRRASVDAAVLQRVARAAEAVPGARLRWLDEPADRRIALRAIRIAETERFARPALHQELFEAIDFSAGWTRSVPEGLSPAALEVEPPMRGAFAALRRWPLMRALTWLGMHHGLGLRAASLPARLCPHLGLLLCEADEPSRALEAGRALERVWLAATHESLALQPMAAATALVRQKPGGGWVSEAAQQRLRTLLGALCGGRYERAFMLVRVGCAAAPSAVAERRALRDYLQPASPLQELPDRTK